MNRRELETNIEEIYGVSAEYPWASAPSFAVFRHKSNKKWFAVIMTITKDKLGIDSAGAIDVVNLKCDPLLIGSVVKDEGIFPAYHMNKSHWVSVALDGSVNPQQLDFLLNLSYDLTKGKKNLK